MDFKASMTAVNQAQVSMQVDSFNKTLAVNGRSADPQLGKDDFLKLLITQLANQDPTSPMQNTEFIAQMAQFSSLEQITNMSTEFGKLSSALSSSQAMNTVGHTVEIQAGDNIETGVVEAVTTGANPQVMVNGNVYELKQIQKIFK